MWHNDNALWYLLFCEILRSKYHHNFPKLLNCNNYFLSFTQEKHNYEFLQSLIYNDNSEKQRFYFFLHFPAFFYPCICIKTNFIEWFILSYNFLKYTLVYLELGYHNTVLLMDL